MSDKKNIAPPANVPSAKPGSDATCSPVPFMPHPQGKWQSPKPTALDEERLKAVVQHLVGSQAITSAKSYCCQCASENKNAGGSPNYVPVLMMPIHPSEQCPFGKGCGIEKTKEEPKSGIKHAEPTHLKVPSMDKAAKRPFVMQRLTDYDLLSQW